MSVDCRQFTYDDQLASSEKNSSDRRGWFTMCCCPPNVLKPLGMIGRYIWNVSEKKSDITQIDVHLYAPTTLEFKTEAGSANLMKECDWPRDGQVKFSLISASKNVQFKPRIPRWAMNWEVSPPHDWFVVALKLTCISDTSCSSSVRCCGWLFSCAGRLLN